VVSLPVVIESECLYPSGSIVVVAGYVMSGAMLSLLRLRILLESVVSTLLEERRGCPVHVGYVLASSLARHTVSENLCFVSSALCSLFSL
jgi:hypothetical protein